MPALGLPVYYFLDVDVLFIFLRLKTVESFTCCRRCEEKETLCLADNLVYDFPISVILQNDDNNNYNNNKNNNSMACSAHRPQFDFFTLNT